jgi:uncharacterized protein (DUF1330 family)
LPKGYWVPHLDVHNLEGFQPYRDLADAAHKRAGNKLLVRGGRREVVEGKLRRRNVVREFKSYDDALAFYDGPDYSRAHPLRERHSECDFLIVEGYDGVQPTPVEPQPAPAARKGYWIGHVDVSDPEGYKGYVAANARPFAMYGARFLVRGGRCEVKEGRQRARTVVLEFASYDAALACYRSAEYQAAKAIRERYAQSDIVVIEGVDPE